MDKRFIAPLIDLMRFTRNREEYAAIVETLRALTGEKLDAASTDAWERAIVWYGERGELKPPPGYTAWKGELHARLLDPRFKEFLYEGAAATVRLEEVVWGGVKVDGIPALVNPKMTTPERANYLMDTEPVFGVALNGDARAYPLRILDWPEMANDVVDINTGHERPYEIGATYRRYFAAPNTMFPVWRQSRALPRKARVYALQVNGIPKAYPLDALNRAGGVANDSLGGRNLVVVYRDAAGRVPLSPRWIAALREFGAGQSFVAEANATRPEAPGAPGDGQPSANDPGLDAARERIAATPIIARANDMTLAAARAVLQKHPELIRELTVEMMLAMPAEARLALLAERTSDERTGASAEAGRFTPNFRNEVAQRGLIGETRAYERGNHSFKPGKEKDELVDERRVVCEDALLSSEGERLPRLGGHLAYWFGWFAFFPQTKVFTAK
jgi:hypothetical protein